MHTVVALGVLAALVASTTHHVSADEFVFNADACNTLFANPSNWRNGLTPVNGDFSRIVVGPVGAQRWSPVSTDIPQGDYRMNEIVLGWDGQMVFDDDSVFEFSEDADLEGAAYFIAGQSYKEECDYHCHTNWQVNVNGTLVDATRPPCSDDIAIFPEGYSYKVWMQGFTPVGEIQFGANTLTTELNRRRIPSHQTFPEREELDFFLQEDEGLYSLCDAFGIFFNGTCNCLSVCSSEEEVDMFQMQQRDIAEARAAEETALWSSNVTETFLTVYLPELIVGDSRILDVFTTVFTPEFLPELERRLVAKVHEIANSAIVDFRSVDFDVRTSSVILEGDLTATYDFFHDILTGVSTWNSFEVLDSTPLPENRFSYAMWTVIVDYIDEVFTEECDTTINRQRQVCDALYGRACTNIVSLSMTFEPANIASNFALLLPDILSFLDARAPGDTTPYNASTSPVVAQLVLDDGVSLDTVVTAIDTFIAAVDLTRLQQEGYAGSPVEDFVRLHKDCTSSPEAVAAIMALDTAALETHTLSFHVGRSLPYPDVIDILRLPDRSFEDYICETMQGRPTLVGVSCSSVMAVLPDTNRRTVEPKNIGIEVTFDYTIYVSSSCADGQVSSTCPVVEGTNAIYTNLFDILNAAVVLFGGRARGKCIDFVSDLGIDETCAKESAAAALISALMEDLGLTLAEWSTTVVGDFSDSVGICGTSCTINNQVADAAYATDLVALKDDVRNYAFAAAQAWLDTLGSAKDDDFFDGTLPDDDLVVGTTTTTAAEFTTTNPFTQGSSSAGTTSTSSSSSSQGPVVTTADPNADASNSQAGLGLLFIIAGAAGGVIVLLLVVIVFMLASRGKTKTQPTVERSFTNTATPKTQGSKMADTLAMTPRAALAFENPLYDDNDGVAETNLAAAYDQDGLYDEPAELDRAARENPIYQSTDNLDDDDDEEEEGGYLDVEGEPGYLDVTPDDE